MDNLSFNSLGIHFNNAVVMSEQQFQIMMDYLNDMKSQLDTIQLEFVHSHLKPENTTELPKKKAVAKQKTTEA